MFGFSLGHLLIVLFIVVLLNARRLPELGAALGKGMNAFKKGLEGKSGDDALPKDPKDGSDTKDV